MAESTATRFESSVRVPLHPYPDMSLLQQRVMLNNFEKKGHFYFSIDIHTMLDCGPSRGIPTDIPVEPEEEDSGESTDALRFAVRARARQEFFGGLIYNLENGSLFYLDRAAFTAYWLVYSNRGRASITEQLLRCGFSAKEASSSVSALLDVKLIKLTKSVHDRETVGEEGDVEFYPPIDLSVPYLQSPFVVEIEGTHACFRTCKHCAYNSSPLADTSRDLTAEQWGQILHKLYNAGVLSVRFTGGDFLHRRDAFKILDYAELIGMPFNVLSDTVAINKNALARLGSYRSLEYIGSSLDGADAETHDWLRGDGAYELLCERAVAIGRSGARLSLGATLHKRNWRSVAEIGRLASRLGATFFEIGFLTPVGRAESLKEYVLDEAEIEAALDLYVEGIRAGDYLPMQSHYIERSKRPEPFRDVKMALGRLPYSTEWPFSRMRIKPNGITYTAGRVKASPLGFGTNILKESLQSVWRNSPNLVWLRDYADGARLHSLDIRGLPMEMRYE